jgi:hypothetical protein
MMFLKGTFCCSGNPCFAPVLGTIVIPAHSNVELQSSYYLLQSQLSHLENLF